MGVILKLTEEEVREVMMDFRKIVLESVRIRKQEVLDKWEKTDRTIDLLHRNYVACVPDEARKLLDKYKDRFNTILDELEELKKRKN